MRQIRLSLFVAVSAIASLVAIQAVPLGAQASQFSDGSVHLTADGSVRFVTGSRWSISDGTSNFVDGTSNTIAH
jgi:hypothetical protein